MKKESRLLLFPGLQVEVAGDVKNVDVLMQQAAYRFLLLSVLMAVITIALVGPVFYQFVFHSDALLMWVAVTLGNYTLVSLSCYAYSRRAADEKSVKKWERVLLTQNALTGAAWSFGPLVLMGTPLDGGHAAVLTVSLLCVCGVSLGLAIGQRGAFLIFLAAALLPTAVRLLLVDGVLATVLAMLLLVAFCVLAAVGLDFHQALRRLFETQLMHVRSAQEASLARQQAERSTALKSQFVANVSHEIRTPMHAILGMLKLLQNGELNDRQADYVHKVESTARSLLGLLDDILDFSKIEAERMDLASHPFRIDRMLHDLSVVLLANAQSKSVEVLYDIDPSIPKVLQGDAMRLRQVLLNLAGNAVKFTDQGEVVLRIQRVAQHGHDYTLHFSVTDTGMGIAPENLEIIFSEFGQAAGEQRNFPGTGLGLSISRRLVAMMGGVLKVESTPGVGSNFYFDVTFQALPANAEGMLHGTNTATDWQVLVIDGGETARDLAANMCRSWGWGVETATTGEAAIDATRMRTEHGLRPFDVVIVDWTLPGMDGWQTMETMCAMLGAQQLPDFVMVSAYGHERLIERPPSDLSRMGGFLPKPFTASMLFDAIVSARSAGGARAGTTTQPNRRVQRLAGVRVLVVEDNLMNQQVVQELLELEGAEVAVVENGQQAVDLLAGMKGRNERLFDAVLMDLQMPNMDGYAATRIIRNQLGLHNLPVIAITANMMSADKEASISAGMNAHIGKPFNIDLLVRVIQKEHAVTKA